MPQRLAELPKVVGAKQTLKAIQNGRIELVYLARDADERVTAPIREACEQQGVNIVEAESMTELGKACSIEVGAAVAGVLKTGTS
ncbi:MAG: 50S ribosomal protein L7Ae-like protein [Firmicutes bacterium]|jgi:large subunit ribosomal protein L7A|nr:ribosomal L7Ae/L30e/S12e/Gadd45 family protein [Bacillota bacterium]NLO66304.1 50S ribosomal protein L7Ae-like protein [Bacillota bacterium]